MQSSKVALWIRWSGAVPTCSPRCVRLMWQITRRVQYPNFIN